MKQIEDQRNRKEKLCLRAHCDEHARQSGAELLRVPATGGLANPFARRTMPAPLVRSAASAVEEHGEFVIVGEIEFFWAPVLHVFNLPEHWRFRHRERYAIRSGWQIVL